jgi:hypothetical protein
VIRENLAQRFRRVPLGASPASGKQPPWTSIFSRNGEIDPTFYAGRAMHATPRSLLHALFVHCWKRTLVLSYRKDRSRNRDLASAFWALPTGEDVLVYRKPYGGDQEDDWNHKTEPALEADNVGVENHRVGLLSKYAIAAG